MEKGVHGLPCRNRPLVQFAWVEMADLIPVRALVISMVAPHALLIAESNLEVAAEFAVHAVG